MSPKGQLISMSVLAGIVNIATLAGGLIWGIAAFLNLLIPALGSLISVWLIHKSTMGRR